MTIDRFYEGLAAKDFSEEELENLEYAEEDWIARVEIIRDPETNRWTQNMTTILEVAGKYYALDWENGLTEYQEPFFYNQPYEVISRPIVTVTTKWVPVEEQK